MASHFRCRLGLLAFLPSLIIAPAVWAQAGGTPETVTERARPEVDPLGVRMGAFLLFPKLGVAERYNDNIFADENDEVDDFITVISPSVNLQSQWSRHALNVGASADIGRYADNGDEDYEDYNAFANGAVDITRRSRVTGGVSYSELHEDRSSPDDVNGIEPTEYSVLAGDVAFRQQFNRLNARVFTQVRRIDFDDVTAAGGIPINNDDRDRDEYEVGTRLGYEIVPSYEAFVRLTYNERKYDAATDDNGIQRDSNGYEAVGGIRLDLTGKTFGDVFVGYRNQEYDDPTLDSVSGLSYGAALTWNATTLTTAKLNLSRTLEETTANGASGYFANRAGLTVDHELLRNMLIGGGASYTLNDYEGIDREDDVVGFNLYAKYLWNRYLNLSAGYNRTSRDSNIAGVDYDRNVFLVKIEGTL